MGKIRLLVLDVLKPHQPSILELASQISDIPNVDGVDVAVFEIDSKVENVKLTIKGSNVNYEKIKSIIDDVGATVHSIDKVSCGNEIIAEAHTPQDD